ncbi:hypothetical protein [Frankia sp. ACN1ag]|uniref:hypothetical protein n=1 Tax=Frankia sp. ACN1ag TaxID=102891 RepID=UPI0007073C3A|nr:hypothetical protein [Frankia sp. ACN1ag]KQC37914.1 hypothetical protein UK82_13060 [Frankia sp. ACN1ag]
MKDRRVDSGDGPTALDLAGTAFAEVAESGRCVLDGRTVHPDLPTRRIGLEEFQILLAGPATPVSVRAAVWREVSGRQADEGWLVAAVGIALPMLWHVAGVLAAGGPGMRADLDAEVLTGFLGALRARPTPTQVESRLVWGAYRAGVAYAGLHSPPLPVGTCVPVAAALPPRPWGVGLRRLLAQAVRVEALTSAQAELIRSARLGGVSPAVLSAATETPGEEWALRLAVAEERLLRAVLAGELGPRQPGTSR